MDISSYMNCYTGAEIEICRKSYVQRLELKQLSQIALILI